LASRGGWRFGVAGSLRKHCRLCLARAVTRQKELSLCRALGANRWQEVRVGLTENLLIGVAGAIIGLLLAKVGLPPLRQLLPADFPRAYEIALPGTEAAFAAAIAMATVLIAGLLPLGSSDTLQSRRVASDALFTVCTLLSTPLGAD
jgi:predicted lysophospholipase L1 biosynthesis ABC-type transport system permease subunit